MSLSDTAGETVLTPRQTFVVLLVLTAAGWALYPSEYTRGLMHREQGDRSRAIAFFTGYLTRHPHHKGATMSLAGAYEAAGQPEKALTPVRDFYGRRRGDLDTGLLLIDLYERLGQIDAADAFRLELVRDLGALAKPPRRAMEQLLYQSLQRAGAIQDDKLMLSILSQLAEVSSDPGGYRTEMLRIFMKKRRLAAAIEMMRAESRKDPRDVGLRRTIARVLELDGRTDEAVKELDVALALKPGDVGVIMDRSALFTRLKRPEQAEEELKKLIELQPAEAAWPYELGRSLIARGKFREGVRHYEALVTRDPGDRERWMSVVYAYADRGEHDGAARHLERYLDRFPEDDEALELMIYEYEQAGFVDKAVGALSARVRQRPKDLRRRRALANLLSRDERYAEAEEHYRAIVALDPASVEDWRSLAFIQQTLRKNEEAARTLETFLKTHPDDGYAVELLASIYLELGQKPRAIEILRAYLKPTGARP